MPYDMNTLIETYEMRLDIQNVRRIFSTGRPAGSQAEVDWVNHYLFTPKMQEMGMYKDGFSYRGDEPGEGNLIIEIGEGSKTLFSSHTDTVHRTGGPQNVMVDLEDSKLITDSGQCLGADDGTGIWLMLELIKAGVPGLYIFHRAEEVGGQGSAFIANHHADLLQKYDRAIAFDRRDDWSIITHQGGSRCCSDAFGRDLANKLDMGIHRLDTGGSFTDTANYDGIIPECTNLSVGYHNAHSARENQEIPFLLEFRDALIGVDWENLVTERDPTIPDYTYGGSYGYSGTYVYDYGPTTTKSTTTKKNTIEIEEEDWKEWDNQIDDDDIDDEDWREIILEIESGQWDHLWAISEHQMSDREFKIFQYMEYGGQISDEDYEESTVGFWDDDEEEEEITMPSTAQEFTDWVAPTTTAIVLVDDKSEEETEEIPDVDDQELDWDSWFASESL
jgi:hypothetical protein